MKRARKAATAERPPFRVCAKCGKCDGREGPRPAGSMLALVDNVLRYSCSVQCGRELGWRAT